MFLYVNKDEKKIDKFTKDNLLSTFKELLEIERSLNALLQAVGCKPVLDVSDHFVEYKLDYFFIEEGCLEKRLSELSQKNDHALCLNDSNGYIFFFYKNNDWVNICDDLRLTFEAMQEKMKSNALQLIADNKGIEL